MTPAWGARPRIVGVAIALVVSVGALLAAPKEAQAVPPPREASSASVPSDPSAAPSPPPGASSARTEGERVVVRTIAPIDRALHERVVGQVSDLPATVIVAPASVLEPTMTGRIEAARAIAVREGATMVVWFEHAPSGAMTVFVAFPSRARVLVRAVAADVTGTNTHAPARASAAHAPTSASLEVASLVVRTALLAQAQDADAPIGVPDEELTKGDPPAPPPPVAARPKTPAAWPSRPKRLPLPPEPLHLRPFAALGWQLDVDGRSPAGARAATLEAGAIYGPWGASLRGGLGLPSRSHDRFVALDIVRTSIAAFASRTLLREGAWQLDVAAGPALYVYRRSATARDPRFVASPPATLTTVAASVEGRLVYRPAPRSMLRLGVLAGGTALATSPSFSYDSPDGLIERPSWPIELRLGFFTAIVGK